MVIFDDSTIDNVARDLRWFVGRVVVVVINEDGKCDCIAVKVEGCWGDGTPNAFALGKACCNAMTAKRVDAIIFIFSSYDLKLFP